MKAVPKAAQAGSPRETIFVVEDEDRVRLMVVASLKELGYTVIQASNGTEALRLMEEGQHPTLLFTDVVMPNMTGRELADQAMQLISASRCCSPPDTRATPSSIMLSSTAGRTSF